MKVLLDLVLVVLLIATASAFLQSTTRCEKITASASTAIFMESKASPTEAIQSDDESFHETKNDSKKIKSASSSCWSMEMDWTLQDAVPQFTILSKEHTATFWHSFQVAHSEFKQFSESELEERYMYLLNKHSEQEQTTNALPPCGSSPHLLSEWWILEEKNIMGGILPNGSTTWFPISRGGTLQHQSNNSPTIDTANNLPNLLLAIPGGYVVARDGIIYEMGHASKSMISDNIKEMKAPPSQNAPTLMIAHTTQEQHDKHTRKVILTGIVGSAVLSGVLAFAIGTQFAASLVATPNSAPSCPYASSTASHISLLSPSSATSHLSLRSDSTITEQRIIQELRVVREKNAVQTLQKAEQTLQDRIKQDEKVLFQLQREETMQEGAALGFY
ncbi:hypothetical protein FRACYDRAFT_233717 [Fragilariopsis cylindrus CCMP1102]|uniref:Uncharacterized protein n=1 Tax=Fragilariopsis cylindrus CCMP1102 TaxID=635003 RepID=A0A1E7G053_9STRA|nr:hypothetical protein FRACYDRAFT_233717 [Fragilariopsis cylindrus CCMP1102]|eukprot:OEU23543.1 hypothetical protein FRACYDRAFT_233717 [Fragilariopsis cylindrus CCMP1102]